MPVLDSASLVSGAGRGIANCDLLGSAHELVIVNALHALARANATIGRRQPGASIEMGNSCASG